VVPIYIIMQFTKGICLPYTVTNPPTTNMSATELIIGEKYMPGICYVYITLIQRSALKRFVLSSSWRDARYLHKPG
jgi:hypothetical protein